ncbi:RNA binding protein [Cryptosporidium ryanae]|uniref:RNA binding protein n=1 Tax=Cryptosporidium ryanae TaxID=515981 RepID=UPI00351A254D|nr:RNA binding protein [Cryptosporidium ryanae]
MDAENLCPNGETFISRTLYICKLPYDMTEDSVRQLCEPFGDLKKVSMCPRRGTALVEYFDIRRAEGARNTLKSSFIQGRVIDVQYSLDKDVKGSNDKNSGTLFIKTVTNGKIASDPNTMEDYKELFCAYGEVKKVSNNRKRVSEKFVEFYDTRSAEASQKALNGYDFNGVILEIQFANNQSRTLSSELRQNVCERNSFCCSRENKYHISDKFKKRRRSGVRNKRKSKKSHENVMGLIERN